jgi:hypothetical protein
MKLVVTFFLLAITSICLSQTTIYKVDVSNDVNSATITIKEGTASFQMVKFDTSLIYEIEFKLEDFEISVLEVPSNFPAIAIANNEKMIYENLDISKGQQVFIKIKIYSKGTPPKLQKEINYIYKTKPRGEWRTTFGFNFIYKIKQDTYYSDMNEGGTYTIAEGSNRDKLDFHPTLMFTWLSNKHLDKNDDWHVGLSGGLGYNFNESLSVFAGPSFIYNENITLTLGIAFHNQKRLSSNYSSGDIINENLNFDQLHTDYIRVNPFISLSFRLDKNPFGS